MRFMPVYPGTGVKHVYEVIGKGQAHRFLPKGVLYAGKHRYDVWKWTWKDGYLPARL